MPHFNDCFTQERIAFQLTAIHYNPWNADTQIHSNVKRLEELFVSAFSFLPPFFRCQGYAFVRLSDPDSDRQYFYSQINTAKVKALF